MPLTQAKMDVFHGPPLIDHDWAGACITGRESVRELRTQAMRMAEGCPQGYFHPRCPFRMIEELPIEHRRRLIGGMNRNALLQLFAMEHACQREACGPCGTCAEAFGD